jgi:DUF1680 family protein
MELSAALDFSLYLRIPAWAGDRTSVAVNGKRLKEELSAGAFVAIRRNWKSGDTVELELDQPVRTEAVDRQNPDRVAILRGAQVLFAIADSQPSLPRDLSLNRRLAKAGENEWALEVDQSRMRLRPFSKIGSEVYQTYWRFISGSAV